MHVGINSTHKNLYEYTHIHTYVFIYIQDVYTYGQKAQEKMSNITNHYEDTKKNPQ